MKKRLWAIGLDLGGTKIEVALVDECGLIHDRIRISTNAKLGKDQLVKNIIELIQKLIEQNKGISASAIGIGLAGQINKDTGVIVYAPNLAWHDVDLRSQLIAKFNIPVSIYNDVRAATYGEWKFGAGKGSDDLVCVFVGTGIGGGVVSGGKLLSGYNNTAGEIGHMTTEMNGPECHCGNKGCLEALASGWAIERDLKEAISKDKNAGKVLLELAGGNIENVTARILGDALRKKDALATELFDNVTNALTAGATSVVNVFGPSRLILGGGIIEGLPQLVELIEKGLKQYALKAATESMQVLPASLHNDSGVVGAAALVLDTIQNES